VDSSHRHGRLISDASREAVDSLRGYVYQVWRSLLAWLDLDDESALFLEGAEDLDQLRPGLATTIQYKTRKTPITLNSPSVRSAIGHFWEHVLNNPDRSISYRYVTVARIAHEQQDLGAGVPGLQMWQMVREAERWEPLVEPIARHLVEDEQLFAPVREFVRQSTLAEVREHLILPIVWDTSAPEQESIIGRVEGSVAALARTRGFNQQRALAAIPGLLWRVVDVATHKRDRFLSRGDLEDLFESLVRGLADEVVLRALPPISPRFFRRDSVSEGIAEAMGTDGVVALIGATGTGKTNVSVDHALTQSGVWQRVELRDQTPAQIDHDLRTAIRTYPTDHRVNLIIDDVPLQGDYRRFASSLSQLIDVARTANAEVIISSYEPLPPLLRNAINTTVRDFQIPPFSEEDVASFLSERGASERVAKAWARPVVFTTQGHPVLVDARVQSIENRGFAMPTVNDIFETPGTVFDITRQYQRFIGELPEPERTLLYRMSVGARPLRRTQIVALGETVIDGEDAVTHAGDVANRLIGPWLEPAFAERFSVSPLAKGSGANAHGAPWLAGTHRALARALLVDSPVDVFDGVSALTHAMSGEDTTVLLVILRGFLFSDDPEFFSKLWQHFGWFASVGIDVPPIPAIANPLIATMLRSAQYRAASSGYDAVVARKIAEVFDAAVPTSDDNLPLRFLFYSIATVYCTEAIEIHADLAFKLIDLARTVARASSGIATELRAFIEDSPFSVSEIEPGVGVTVIQRLSSANDLTELIEYLGAKEPSTVRLFLRELAESQVMWNGIVANLIISERGAETPNYPAVVDALLALHTFCQSIGSVALSIKAVASASRVAAEFSEDIPRAEEILASGLQVHGNTPRLRLAEAAILHVKGNAGAARSAFEEAIAAIPYEYDDVEPVNDLRLAAADAAATGDYASAATLFESAASRLGAASQRLYRIGLLADATYCAWRSDDEPRSLGIARHVGEELAGYDGDLNEVAYKNLTRRAGFVISKLAWNSVAEAEPSELPSAGFASNVDPINDDQVTPTDLILVLIAQLELRVASEGEFFARFRDRLRSADHPAGDLAQVIGLYWSIFDGSPIDAVDFTLGMRRAREGHANLGPRSNQLEITLIGASLVGAIRNRILTVEVLAEARRRAPAGAGDELSDWLDQVVRFFADPGYTLDALRGSFGTYLSQFGAAIVTGARPDTSPVWLFFCAAIWVDNLAQEGSPRQAVDVLLDALRVTWRDCIANRRFLMVNPRQTVPILSEALDRSDGDAWSKIATIMQAAAAAVDRQVPDRTVATLRNRGALS
jgi:hypothetical protein